MFARSTLVLALCSYAFYPTAHAGLTADQWRADLAQLDAEVRVEHVQPFHALSEAEWDALIENLRNDIPNLSDKEIVVRMAGIMAAIGDGHTRLTLPRRQPELGLRVGHSSTPEPNDPDLRFHRLPVSFFVFDEGLFVVDAMAAYSDLLGAEVLAFDDTPVLVALEKITPVVHRDNNQGLKDMTPDLLALPEVLQAMGITREATRVSLAVRNKSGTDRTVLLTPIVETESEWFRNATDKSLMRSHGNERFWHEWLNNGQVLYVHLYEINDDDQRLLVPWFVDVLKDANERGTQRLILDLRRNYGGDASHNRGLVMALQDIGNFNRPGGTYVLIGRSTFSAAQNLVNDLEQWSRAILVGEATGSRPGGYGDARKLRLQHSGLTIRVSTRYHEDWLGPIGRQASLPDLPAPVLASDWLENNDTALVIAMEDQPLTDPGAWYRKLLDASGFDHATVRLWQYHNDPFHVHEDFSGRLTAVSEELLGLNRVDEAYYTALLAKNLFPSSTNSQVALEAALKAREAKSLDESLDGKESPASASIKQ